MFHGAGTYFRIGETLITAGDRITLNRDYEDITGLFTKGHTFQFSRIDWVDRKLYAYDTEDEAGRCITFPLSEHFTDMWEETVLRPHSRD